MKTVEQLLRSKSNQIFSIAPGVTVFEGLKLMAEKNIGALVVIEAGRVVGIFSERDYARKVTLEGKSSKDTPIRDVMTARVIGVTPANTVEDCMALMTDKHIRHLPVLDDEQLVGVISIGDVVKSIIAEQGLLIEHLVHYITGR